MKPIKFNGMNANYTKEGCSDLPACKIDDVIITCWKMNKEEKIEFEKNGVVYLSCHGNQPPVYLSPEKPFKKSK